MTVKDIQITDIEDFESVNVISVLVREGDEVAIDQPLVTVESEKAMMDYPSPFAGKVEKVVVKEGAQVSEGDTLVTLSLSEISESKKEPQPSLIESDQSPSVNEVSAPVKKTSVDLRGQQAYASPEIHKYARELGVDLDEVQGSGRNQRIVVEDVQQHVRQRLKSDSSSSKNATANKLNFTKYGATRTDPLNKIQKLTADNMLHSWKTIPHVTHFDQADVTQLEQHRKILAEELKEKEIKLTPLAFVIKALVLCLKKFNQFNSSIDPFQEEIIYKDFFHMGIAVDTEYGLYVPVLRNVDKKTLEQVASEIMEISSLAKQRKLTLEHMGGASMTISSLGNLGGQAFTPIINSPEVAILGLSKIIVNEKMTPSGMEQQKLLPLSLSYDHRAINGADAARFCTYLKNVLEDVWRLIL